MFTRCLLFAMGFILLNIACVLSLSYHNTVPIWVNIALNTLYFFVSIILASMYAYMMFDAILEHVYDKHCLLRAKIVLFSIIGISSILTVVNLFTGIVFYIDAAGYHRGPFNRAYYLLLITELIFICICYIRNRKSVSDKILYVIKSLPVIILLICGLQILYPEVLLNGTICAVASLIIFIAFRSSTEDQDAMTGVNSRKAFIDELSLRTGTDQSIQMVQVSVLNIADLNMRYNHDVGDSLLYEVAHFLRHSCAHAQVFRTGGASFTVLLPFGSPAQADAQLSLIQNRLQSDWEMGTIKCRLNVAIAELRTQKLVETPAEIVEQIEYTMSLAKLDPPLVRFDDTVRAKMDSHSSMLAYLRKSIEERRFSVFYQPLYCCRKDIFCSAEALLRLSDEDGKPISPDVFIPLAEETGMIEELTWMVLEDICKQFNSGKFPELQYVSINLSMKQLLDPLLPEQIKACLDKYGVSTKCIKVEITERFILHDAEYAHKQMSALESQGIEVSMDDFGTGYSNLSNVLQFPFSYIKLDRSLITPIVENKHAAAMVGALIKLFGDMDKRIVAEGVETKEQVDMLRSLGIDMIQGFYYARPMPSHGLADYFSGKNN